MYNQSTDRPVTTAFFYPRQDHGQRVLRDIRLSRIIEVFGDNLKSIVDVQMTQCQLYFV